MNCIIRGVRVLDLRVGLDAVGQDVWISDGRIIAIYKHIGEGTLPVFDLTPPRGRVPCILCPGFIDLHTHVREADPDGADNQREGVSEAIASAAMAAAAGGFTAILTMADTRPPVDSPERVAAQTFRGVDTPVDMFTAAAVTRNLEGDELVDIAGCARAGAAAFTDDSRNAAPPQLLSQALVAAAKIGRPVMVHPEDEALIAAAGGRACNAAATSIRPPIVEDRAVDFAISAAVRAVAGRLHLQHLSTELAVQRLRLAKADGIPVTAEVTPHHLGMWLPLADTPQPASLGKVNPPLRQERDRVALIQALRDGLIDVVATDHSPHRDTAKTGDYETSTPGFIGLETALSVCLTFGGMGGDWIPVLIERLTTGPFNVLGEAAGLREPRLRIGEAATCVLFDPAAEWIVGERPLLSGARNTPLMGAKLSGKVLLTLIDGIAAYRDWERLPDTAAKMVEGV